ncbi:sulfocyanin [Acidianus infernus]|uniref:Sulfocyanin n=1 Tax=Acidianus infernus TaxID=12915 RepID=A0A6A9QG21_ACIIN|nr:sulfocyanin-like copper-binding protein [Acidianus infernus]MUM65719.1 sulfocyanin [Acidianus infernus]
MNKAVSTSVVIVVAIALILVAVAGYYLATRSPIPVGTTTLPPSTVSTVTMSTTPVTTTTTSVTTSVLPPGARPLPYNPSTKTVYLYIASLDSGSPYNFNGTSDGELHIFIPAGWKVCVIYTNYEPIDHNFIIVKNTTAVPHCSIIPSSNIILYVGVSSSNYFDSGISSGASATGSIVLSPGYYWFACGYEDHAESGMWGVIECSSSITQPYYEVTNEEIEEDEEDEE